MTTASKITLIRVLFIPIYMVLMYLSGGESGTYMYAALGVFILASITDYIDGVIARKCNQVTDFGKFLDPLADKLLTISAMVMFCQWDGKCPAWDGIFPAWALMVVLTREFAVTGLRMVAVGKGKVIAAGKSGKFKTASSMIGLCVLMAFPDVPHVAWIVVAVVVVTTVYSGIEYFVKNWNCLWDE